ncbi:MAG: ATP-binding cassette domain-containing protein [Bacteroidales bacterium]|nr:ATP-binding cassette domain-containing protein [Bacteroidales bacterium]
MLQIENISKSYGTFQALRDINLHVERGRIFGLLGPNGAGKSTLIRIINRIALADSGRILLEGHPMTDDDVRHIGYLPEERGLYKKMRVAEQAIYLARLKGLSRNDAEQALHKWLQRFEITSWANKTVEQLSKGMQQKLQFIVTVMHSPQLLIFDEPFSGFDPVNANLLKQEILRMRDEGATVILSSHNMASVEELCDDIALINASHVVLHGTLQEIRAQHPSMSLNDIFIQTVSQQNS